ncbi:ATP-binding protein [Nocardia nova]|uniref:sensor histidine kinase n=1 Tax=Nocardia nova TaxID=37330 RepID=UPI001C497726|nr:ATP-binding protein [Nocardia nova]MBV7702963.1 ATP-binding protein [Nocardia nova]
MFRPRIGIRTRVVAVAAIPCMSLLLVAVGAAGHFLQTGQHARDWAAQNRRALEPVVTMVEAMQQERQLTMVAAQRAQPVPTLASARAHVDHALADLTPMGEALAAIDPTGFRDVLGNSVTVLAKLPATRSGIDAGTLNADDAYDYYNRAVEVITTGSAVAAQRAPDTATARELSTGLSMFRAVEAMSRAHALAAAATPRGFTAEQLQRFTREVGYYRIALDHLAWQLSGPQRDRLRALSDSGDWRTTIAAEDALIVAAPAAGIVGDAASEAAAHATSGLLELWRAQNAAAGVSAQAAGDRISHRSMLAAFAAVAIAVIAVAAALVAADRPARRLVRLRTDTTDLAERRLPAIMSRLRRGEQVQIDNEVVRLDPGADEIGDVAAAFNQAQFAAISAAASEAVTRNGVRAVFVNIAHRSQLVVHRQLEVLDQAERDADDPSYLQTLFALDHLATRARRNAENLIILGGERPARRWRNPVSLFDIVRSAAAETTDYQRVDITRLPDVRIAGHVVADVVHLLAELMDNATAFSPPQSRVRVDGRVIGGDVRLAVCDQGLGMDPAELGRRNELLSAAPDFGIAALTGDFRLGLFVVAALAGQHGLSVRLTESEYGGISAVVSIPATLLSSSEAIE